MADITSSGTAPTKVSRKDTVSARQARFGATAGLYTLVVIAALILVNWLSNRYNKTYDTTSNKRFTLSQETQKLVKNLKSDATITYIDKGSGFDQARGMLDRYKNLSSKIHCVFPEPLMLKSASAAKKPRRSLRKELREHFSRT